MLTELLAAVLKQAVHLALAYPTDPSLPGWLAQERLPEVPHHCLQHVSLKMGVLCHEQQLIKPQHPVLMAPFLSIHTSNTVIYRLHHAALCNTNA